MRLFDLASAVLVLPLRRHPSLTSHPSLIELVFYGILEEVGLVLIRKIEANLAFFGLKRVEIRPWTPVSELVVDFLVENHAFSIHVDDANEIRPFGVVFDQTYHST